MTAVRREALARVAARIREELGRLREVASALEEALDGWDASPQDRVTTHWVGGLIHDFYTGLEKAFAEISPELNGLDGGEPGWHRALLHTMTLDLPGFRPPVIRADLEPRLAELLKFRHLYRNLYSFQLRWDRVRELATETLSVWPEVEGDLAGFATSLDTLARA
jgi:hypothetical protein